MTASLESKLSSECTLYPQKSENRGLRYATSVFYHMNMQISCNLILSFDY
jgi:hypothetical protein